MILIFKMKVKMRKEINRFFYTILYFAVAFIVKLIQVNYEIYKGVFKR